MLPFKRLNPKHNQFNLTKKIILETLEMYSSIAAKNHLIRNPLGANSMCRSEISVYTT